MRKAAICGILLFCASPAHPQAARRIPGKAADLPACPAGAICFSGKVSAGEEFRRPLNADLEFVLERGWTITVVPKRAEGDCTEFASVVNAPYRAHRSLNIDTSYGWTGEEEVSTSPREFRFVTNCNDYRIEAQRLNIVMWPYTATAKQADEAAAKLGTLARGKGRLWITDSRISHTGDTPAEKLGKIESMSFRVEITLPRR
jgi:hypothetical protein